MEQNRFATVDATIGVLGSRAAHGAAKIRATAAEQWRVELRRRGVEPIE